MSNLGDRLKVLEMAEAGRRAVLDVPVIARLDGRAFHTYTRGMKRPFDERMQYMMRNTTSGLVAEFHALVGYTQSDEITLVWDKPTLFDGRFQKLTSVLAGYASATFMREHILTGGFYSQTPCFDCRVFQVNNLDDALDVLAWREDDAVKNSVAMAAQSVYSHKQLMNKHRGDMMDMLHAKGINWNDYPAHFKRGIYLKRIVEDRTLTEAERDAIPEAHRPPADRVFKRGSVKVLDIEPIRQLPDAKITLFTQYDRE
jgi:tRNA(His) 5'-end guanylyltransferase